VRAGDFLFVSGQGPVDVANDRLSNGDIRHETRLVLGNIRRMLEGCGASMADVVKCTVYLLDAGEFAAMNEVYAEFFGERKPARTTVEVRFVAPMRVEIDAIAYKPKSS
jgi:2-iminobutanoate/2-iminopropanoate deaminase